MKAKLTKTEPYIETSVLGNFAGFSLFQVEDPLSPYHGCRGYYSSSFDGVILFSNNGDVSGFSVSNGSNKQILALKVRRCDPGETVTLYNE